jgi:osmotically-inducible protein OsmY
MLLTSLFALSAFTGCAGGPVAKSTGEFIDDATITAKVKASMIADPVVKALDVGVDTYKGTVQLNGFVDTAEQKSRAEQIARGVDGVAQVQNRLTVKPRTAPAPAR